MVNIMFVVGVFLIIIGFFVVILILYCEVQIIYQIEEISIMISCYVIGLISYKVVCIGIRVIVKFRQYIGLVFDVVYYVIIMFVIERIVICKFQFGKCQMGL